MANSAGLRNLIQSNDSKRQVVQELVIQSVQLNQNDANILYAFCDDLKLACHNYKVENTALVAHYIDSKDADEARRYRKERFEVIHKDAKECLDVINLQLEKLEVDKVSDIHTITPSLLTFVTTPPKAAANPDNTVKNFNDLIKNNIPDLSMHEVSSPILNHRPCNINLRPKIPSAPASINLNKINQNLTFPSNTAVPSNQQPCITQNHRTAAASQAQYANVGASPLNTNAQVALPQVQYVLVQPAANQQFSPHNPQVSLPNQPQQYVSSPLANLSHPVIAPAQGLSESECHRLKCDLLKGMGDPFSGSAGDFNLWRMQLQKNLDKCSADSADSLQILLANTSGPVKAAVKRYMAASTCDDTTLASVWDMLKDRYGSDDRIADNLLSTLHGLEQMRSDKDLQRLEIIVDTCRIASNSILCNRNLSILNHKSSISLVLNKLPMKFSDFWRKRHVRHVQETGNPPDFELFVSFLEQNLVTYSMPCAQADAPRTGGPRTNARKAYRTERVADSSGGEFCVYHQFSGHNITNCHVFSGKSFKERKGFAIDNKLCFNCLGDHKSNECSEKQNLKCKNCPGKHISAMHRTSFNGNPTLMGEGAKKSSNFNSQNNRYHANNYNQSNRSGNNARMNHQGAQGEVLTGSNAEPVLPSVSNDNSTTTRNACSKVCGPNRISPICSKTMLVDLRYKKSGEVLRGLGILDEQSNASFCDESVMRFFKAEAVQEDYDLNTLNGKLHVKGWTVSGLEVRGFQQTGEFIPLPSLFTHPSLPNTRNEVATSEVVKLHPHIARYASKFPHATPDFDVLLLVGADCDHLMASWTHGSKAPYVHETLIGYAMVGRACLDVERNASSVKVFRTSVLQGEYAPTTMTRSFVPNYAKAKFETPFDVRSDDDLTAMSQENTKFMDVVTNSVTVNEKGNIQMAIPLRSDAQLPDNRLAVYHRTKNTLMRLKRNAVQLQSCIKVMGEYISAGQVEELAQPTTCSDKVCYIPIFPVYNESKGKTRLVFDSSASFKGKSLNDAMLAGPDEGNKLVGVLMRFRLGEYAFSADVEKMYHAFFVQPEDRDMLRYWWFKNNDPEQPICEYRAKVMIFGNKASPACSTFGLRYATYHPEAQKLTKSCELLTKNTYVDDLLGASDSAGEAIESLTGCVEILGRYNIRLHKIVASSNEVSKAFPESERAQVPVGEYASENRALGMIWCPHTDTLALASNVPIRPFTRRGLLAVVHSVYDPLGLWSPTLLGAKLMQREIMPAKTEGESSTFDWDEPLPQEYSQRWHEWIKSMDGLSGIRVGRCVKPVGFGHVIKNEIHCFTDASKDSIGHAIYLKCFSEEGEICVTLIFGSSKVSPRTADTIPRMELSGAMDSVSSVQKVIKELSLNVDAVHYYTDSLVVLGYLRNTTKRFSRYVARRVQEILKFSDVEQWNHISGKYNVGDIATKPHTPAELERSEWFTGPKFLKYSGCVVPSAPSEAAELPEEVQVKSLKSQTSTVPTMLPLVEKVSAYTGSWRKAISIISVWIRLKQLLLKRPPLSPQEVSKQAKLLLIKQAQRFYQSQSNRLLSGEQLLLKDPLSNLSPFIDNEGLIRVGGKLSNANFPYDVKYPVLLPDGHPISKMIVIHHHEKVCHQGRVLTLGALRQAGFHIFHASKVIKNLIKNCVFCRKLRGNTQHQIMADLPSDRLENVACFSQVGIDMAGPWHVFSGKSTRRTAATRKVWILIVTCLASRAIHIEVVPAMDTVSFELALRRFIAIRGTCSLIKSDNGSNFLGAISSSEVDMSQLQRVAASHNITWELNPPYASNYGGVFERKLKSLKDILNATLKLSGKYHVSLDEFSTLIQESASIVNNSPLWNASSDPNDPCPLSPANILTLKDHPNPHTGEFSEEDLLQFGKRRWRRVMYLSEQFWVRWRKFYLHSLHERRRWKTPNHSINTGDIVLLRGKSKRNEWPMGTVEKVRYGSKGVVRRVWIRTAAKSGGKQLLERSVRDTVLLIPNLSSKNVSGESNDSGESQVSGESNDSGESKVSGELNDSCESNDSSESQASYE